MVFANALSFLIIFADVNCYYLLSGNVILVLSTEATTHLLMNFILVIQVCKKTCKRLNIFVCFVVFVKLMWVSLLWYNSSLQYNCSFCKFCCENIDLDMVYFMLESYDIYSDLNGLCDIGKIWKNWYQFFLTGNHPENKCFIQIFFLTFYIGHSVNRCKNLQRVFSTSGTV